MTSRNMTFSDVVRRTTRSVGIHGERMKTLCGERACPWVNLRALHRC